MPRVDTGADARGYQLPGVYATLLAEQCERASAPDARLFLTMEPDEFERLEEQGRLKAAVLFTELLEAGEPIIAARWRIGGHRIPVPEGVPMFSDRTIRLFRVSSDDVITPSGEPAA